ncbi:hypothetical protein TrVFT333_006480 [Trichoderma virens FT-333]|nr:hypothetical protein TrVFT333_006480 [Trichoderma virens FT-333]
MPNWQDLQNSLNLFLRTPSDLRTRPVGAQRAGEESFILSNGYYDLNVYVTYGKALPSTSEAFDSYFMKKEECKSLNEKDPLVYDLVRDTVLQVQNECQRFHNQSLGKLITLATEFVEFCQYACAQLRDNGDDSLTAKFEILLDEVYVSGPRDERFNNAVVITKDILHHLQQQTLGIKVKAREVATELRTFKGNINPSHENIQRLQKLFWDGPVTDLRTDEPVQGNNGEEIKSYARYLDSEFARIVADITEKNELIDQEKNKKIRLGLSIAMTPFCALLIILVPAEIIGLVQIREEIEKLENEIKVKEEDKKACRLLITAVSLLHTHFTELLKKMDAAIAALEELEELFRKQSIALGHAGTAFDSAIGSLSDASHFASRSTWLRVFMKQAPEEWNKVEQLANKLLDSRNNP